jgi:hypothetical protein
MLVLQGDPAKTAVTATLQGSLLATIPAPGRLSGHPACSSLIGLRLKLYLSLNEG